MGCVRPTTIYTSLTLSSWFNVITSAFKKKQAFSLFKQLLNKLCFPFNVNKGKRMIKRYKDEAFLRKYYEDCRKYVAGSQELCFYADEKFRHSMQVVGAGNYLLKHEKTFQNWTEQEKYLAWLGCLFHDVGRFREICKRYENKDLHGANLRKYDHGEFSYEILQTSSQYLNPLLLFPIRHHGHLDADFFGEAGYLAASQKDKETMKNIFFLIKDADKIANFYLFRRHPEYYGSLICGTEKMRSAASPKVVESLSRQELCRNADIATPLDQMLRILSWVFDIKFKQSFVFLKKLGCIEDMLLRIQENNIDNKTQEKIEKVIKNFITESINETNIRGNSL